MKIKNKETDMGMAYYLKKFWGANILATLPILTVCALQTGTSLAMIQTFQSIIERDLRGFGFWIVMMAGAWFLLLGINSLQKFFQGGDCAQEQAAATGKLKDLLAGYDVLCFFGREQRFGQGVDTASDQIEKPRFRLTYVKGFVSAGMDCVNVLCQMLVNVLIGVLSIRGVILQGSLMGGGNLCGSLSNGLGNMAQLLLSFSASRPYFEKIIVHADDTQTVTDTGMEQMNSAIIVENLSFQYGERPVRLWEIHAVEAPAGLAAGLRRDDPIRWQRCQGIHSEAASAADELH